MKKLATFAAIAISSMATSQAVVVSISSADFPVADFNLVNFINSNFSNVTSINQGYYTTAASVPVGTDVLIIGRRIFSNDFANAANSLAFNQLTIPIVAVTSYVIRPDADRWGWESGGIANMPAGTIDGNETTVTAAGAAVFGAAGTYDWYTTSGTKVSTDFNAAGTGTVGGGEILATIGGNILVAAWETGESTAGGTAVGGNRLLFNMPDYNSNGGVELPNTAAGQAALRTAIDTYTPLTAIPEPSGTALLLGGLGMLTLLRRRNA